jgi:hypothetical protein
MFRRVLVFVCMVGCLGIVLTSCSATRSSSTSPTAATTSRSTGVPTQTTPPLSPSPTIVIPNSPIINTWGWQGSADNVLNGGQVVYFPTGGALTQSGRTLTLTWSANGNVEAFILTSGQFDDSLTGQVISASAAHGQGQNGSISVYAQNADTFFAVVRNMYPQASVTLFQAQMAER